MPSTLIMIGAKDPSPLDDAPRELPGRGATGLDLGQTELQ
jgi:hypothetical protein